MTQSPSDLRNILINELGVDATYRHAPKYATSDETLEISGAILKWYAVHPQDRSVPTDIAQLARSYLKKTALEARGFGPESVQTHDFIADVRVGGKYRWDLSNAEGAKMTARGEYRELEPGRKIVFTWQWDDDETWENHISIVTVELSDHDGGTELRLVHEQLPNVASRDGHTGGWNSALNKLEKFVSK